MYNPVNMSFSSKSLKALKHKKKKAFRSLPFGEPGGIRTHDLLIRSQTLYPAELRAHMLFLTALV